VRSRVLIVEDDAPARGALRELLVEFGVDVVGEAEDGVEALERVEELSPDVVLMDARMPRMDGIEATRRIKSQAPRIQVVVLSAYDEPLLQQGAGEAGAYCYLVKGCPPEMIRDMIARAHAHGRALDTPTPQG